MSKFRESGKSRCIIVRMLQPSQIALTKIAKKVEFRSTVPAPANKTCALRIRHTGNAPVRPIPESLRIAEDRAAMRLGPRCGGAHSAAGPHGLRHPEKTSLHRMTCVFRTSAKAFEKGRNGNDRERRRCTARKTPGRSYCGVPAIHAKPDRSHLRRRLSADLHSTDRLEHRPAGAGSPTRPFPGHVSARRKARRTGRIRDLSFPVRPRKIRHRPQPLQITDSPRRPRHRRGFAGHSPSLPPRGGAHSDETRDGPDAGDEQRKGPHPTASKTFSGRQSLPRPGSPRTLRTARSVGTLYPALPGSLRNVQFTKYAATRQFLSKKAEELL